MSATNPAILTWARETAGLSLEEGSRKLGLKGFERLSALERGEDEPSRSLLLKMAGAYRRSLLVFYLREPPKTGDRGQDFRRLPGGKASPYNADLEALLRDIKGRQTVVKSLLEDTESETLSFVGSATMADSADKIARLITKSLGFSLLEFRAQKSVDLAFAYLREQIEAMGVFVLLLGNLGSHHTNIPVEIFRGFAIADPIAPFVVLNDQDAKMAWPFTALHELTHLWLGTTGISGTSNSAIIEKYCNEVAGEILLPVAEMSELGNIQRNSLEEAMVELAQFAQQRHVSRSMVAYKLFRSNLITTARWEAVDARLRKDYLDTKQKVAGKQTSTGGPNYYVVRRHKLGKALLGLVNRSLNDGRITYTKAGQVLGVRPGNVSQLLRLGTPKSDG